MTVAAIALPSSVAPDSSIQDAADGAGPLDHRKYSIEMSATSMTGEDLLDLFCRAPNRFSPTSYAVFVPEPGPDGLQVGDEITVELPGPWDGPVRVSERSSGHVKFITRVGHMEAGWIEFRTNDSEHGISFEIESEARAGDVVFDALYHRLGIAKLVQTDMWVNVLEAAVRESGGEKVDRPKVTTTIYEGGTL